MAKNWRLPADQAMKNTEGSNGKSPFLKGLFLPYPLVVGAVVCIVVLLFQAVIAPSDLFYLLTSGGSSNVEVLPPVSEEGEFPVIPYESQYATLNVDGWEEKDIPVYFGDNNALLRKGAGMWINSRFFGQEGKTVLSAHVTSHFYEIEDTAIGDLIRVNTIYGDYVYKVTDIVIFHYEDGSLLYPEDGEGDMLLMYTCYPRENGYRFKSERIALICKKIEGKDWGKHE